MVGNILKKRACNKDIKSFKKLIKHALVRDDDILTDSSKEEIKKIQTELFKLNSLDREKAVSSLTKLSTRFNKVMPSKNWKIVREYAEIIVVALTVAFGVRALYIQPFKIPTSSMQPTLFGIHYVDKNVVPDIFQPINYALYSTQRAKLITDTGGSFNGFYPPFARYVIFPWSALEIGMTKYSLPGTQQKVSEYCFESLPKSNGGYRFPDNYSLSNGWLSQGDHLFVNRFSYHFSNPKRGDIVVFTTEGIYNDATGKELSEIGFYYVKRLIGMPGDTLKVINNVIQVKTAYSNKFIPITNFNIKAINRIYSDKGGYQGHFAVGRFAEGKEVKIPDNSYFMLGDNSFASSDGRYWGFVPKRNIVGKAFFVFWPFTRRWGIADSAKPLNVPTVIEKDCLRPYIPAMRLQ